jgi:hypothetical protein
VKIALEERKENKNNVTIAFCLPPKKERKKKYRQFYFPSLSLLSFALPICLLSFRVHARFISHVAVAQIFLLDCRQ